MKHSRAFTLVEMLTCISVGSVLLGLAVSMVHRTMRIESTARSSAQVERTASLLSRQFRQDIHRTKTFSLEGTLPEEVQLRLTLPEQSNIIYRLSENSVYREQQNSGQTHRETFSFPSNHSFQITELSDPVRLALTLEHDANLIDVSPQIKLHVEAVVGQLFRLIQPREISE